jgi:hypothetical protein
LINIKCAPLLLLGLTWWPGAFWQNCRLRKRVSGQTDGQTISIFVLGQTQHSKHTQYIHRWQNTEKYFNFIHIQFIYTHRLVSLLLFSFYKAYLDIFTNRNKWIFKIQSWHRIHRYGVVCFSYHTWCFVEFAQPRPCERTAKQKTQLEYLSHNLFQLLYIINALASLIHSLTSIREVLLE